jgi:hypothetical protein
VALIDELKAKLRERVPGINEVRALFPSIIFTNTQTKQRSLVKYILSGFHANSSPSVTIDFEGMTIEHLAPQSLIGSGPFSDEIIGQIGNLILVPSKLNTKLDDKPFKEKKKILQNAGVSLPQEFAQLLDISPDNIQVRTVKMAELAYQKVWKI